jgi:DNA polymerase IV
MTDMVRTIIHLDMDAFYASVEQLDDPALRLRPVIVGGSVQRGVVCACSYEARSYGVRSAMAMSRAMRLCPQGVFLPVRMERYRQVSQAVFAIFRRYTDHLEALSLDEAFLDVSDCGRLFGSGVQIAQRIRQEVRSELGLAVSAGVASNKLLAKLASEQAKPDGLCEVSAAEVDRFLLPLPVSALWGVGEVLAKRLQGLGLRSVGDLRAAGGERLGKLLGRAGTELYLLSQGLDQRPVAAGAIKSLGHEDTYANDLWDSEDLRRELLALAGKVSRRLRQKGLAGRTATLKVRYSDFSTVTRAHTFAEAVDTATILLRAAEDLLGKTEAGARGVRLLGLSVGRLQEAGSGQQPLFGGQESQRRQALDLALDHLSVRFGEGRVLPATLLPAKKGSSNQGGNGGQGS